MDSTTVNGRKSIQPDDGVRQAARDYISRGYCPVPADPRSKKCTLPGWQNLRPTEADLDNLFPSGKSLNVGWLTGVNGLLDADLDCREAVDAAVAGLLPSTSRICGHKSHPMSHWFYASDDGEDTRTQKWKDLDGATLCELRGARSMTIVPPSVHRETGEKIEWHEQGDPAQVEATELRGDLAQVAAAALLARHWPRQGSRHAAALALAGGLLTAGVPAENAERFIAAVAAAARDPEARDRVAAVASTRERIDDGQTVTGWRELGEALPDRGPAVVRRIRGWLGLDGAPARGDSAAGQLVALATRTLGVELFHTPDEVAFVAVPVGDHREVYALTSRKFKRLLSRRFYQTFRRAAGGQAMTDALGVLEGMAFDEAEHHVHVRTAGHEGRIYIDLGDPQWRAVEVDTAGWRVVPQAPVFFRRGKGTLPLPEPAPGGSVNDLWKFANVPSEQDRLLLLGCLVASLRPRGPYPILTLTGQHGSAKSTLGRLLQLLVDPNAAELRAEPLSVRDLAIAAATCRLLAFDNLSYVPSWLSNALCRLSTGGSVATRELYSDAEETIFYAQRPTLVTSIGDVVTAPDLLDRAVFVQLEPIDDDKRLAEEELMESFLAARPRILGGLLDALSAGLRTLPDVKLTRLPRMADFARFAEACLRGIGVRPGAFLEAYEANRADVNVLALESCLFAPFLLRPGFKFEGTAATLLARLNELADEQTRKTKGWPLTPQAMGNALRRAAPNLKKAGKVVEVGQREGKARRRTITIKDSPGKPSAPSASSATSSGPDGTPSGQTTCGDGSENTTSEPSRPPAVRQLSADGPPPPPQGEADNGRITGGQPDPPQPSAPNSSSEQGLRPEADKTDEADGFPGEFLSRSAYTLVTSPADLAPVLEALTGSVVVALDIETIGLNPRSDRIRLLQLATDAGRVFLMDLFTVPADALTPLFEVLGRKGLVIHNAKFELSFLNGLGLAVDCVSDTMVLSMLLDGSRPKGWHSLAEVAERELGVRLDKEMQKSDWSGALTPRQLEYAAADVRHLISLHERLYGKVKEAGLEGVAAIEYAALPAVVWLAGSGAPFDRDAWQSLAQDAAREAWDLEARLAAAAPPPEGKPWNWNSWQQVQRVFALVNIQLEDTADETLARVAHPLATLLRKYRAAKKRQGTYGDKWLRHVSDDGRVYADWRQLGSDAGRMSCAKPNLQQLPRGAAYRRCVRAPEGRVLVKADYSQIELRLAAKISGDEAMLEAYARGDDLHLRTAQRVLGVETVTKEHRQLAKSLNFGLLYGMGAPRFLEYARCEFGVELTLEQARRYRESFFDAYPGLRAWHRSTPEGKVATRTLTGRRRSGITRFTEKLNTPVQGSGADGLKQALALLWERREVCPGAFPVLAVHDEVVVECDAGQAEAAAGWVKAAMIDGMAPLLDPVPCVVEVAVGQTWAGD
jgi:DNA polymerase-1